MGDRLYKGMALGASVGAAAAARNAATAMWRRRTGEDPPSNPAAPSTSWARALAWTLIVGTLVAIARLLAQRGAAEAYRIVEGDYPAALQDVT